MNSSAIGRRLAKLETEVEARRRQAAWALVPRQAPCAPAPVVAGVDDSADWDRHRQGVYLSLAPVTPLVGVLTDRVALLTWRLARAARAETAAIEAAQERINKEMHHEALMGAGSMEARLLTAHPEDIEDEANDAATLVGALTHFDAPADAPVRGEEASTLLYALYDAAAPEEGADVPIPGTPAQGEDEALEDWCERVPWTAGLLRTALGAFAAYAEREPAAVLADVRERAEGKAERTAAALRTMEAERGRRQAERLVPDALTMERLGKYEAALERSLSHALAELAALQARRPGAPAAGPLSDD